MKFKPSFTSLVTYILILAIILQLQIKHINRYVPDFERSECRIGLSPNWFTGIVGALMFPEHGDDLWTLAIEDFIIITFQCVFWFPFARLFAVGIHFLIKKF